MEVSREQLDAAAALAARFTDSWNGRDGRTYGDAYWPDAELVDPTGTIWDGRDAIEQMHVDLWRGPANATRVDARVRRVRVLSPTLMVVDLEVTVAGFAPAPPGAAVTEDGMVRANLKHVAEMRAGEWKIIASQNTFVAGRPPQER